MLEKEVATIENLVLFKYCPEGQAAWNSIKTALAELGTTPNTGTRPKLLDEAMVNKMYYQFIFDARVDEVTVSGAQEFRDFIVQQLRAGETLGEIARRPF